MVTSIGAMLITVLLIIFFGAWAVSASSEGNLSGVLSSATVGFSGQVSQQSVSTGAAMSSTDVDNVPRLASAASAGSAPADTWWGKALLGACPLH